jgi:hypothetical protein
VWGLNASIGIFASVLPDSIPDTCNRANFCRARKNGFIVFSRIDDNQILGPIVGTLQVGSSIFDHLAKVSPLVLRAGLKEIIRVLCHDALPFDLQCLVIRVLALSLPEMTPPTPLDVSGLVKNHA